jgi:hypothetical protein
MPARTPQGAGPFGVMSTTSTKIAAVKIEILWTEADNYKRPAFDSWADVDIVLFGIGATVKGGGYHKTAFRVTWADGETYEGRIDARPGRTNIREHMRDYCLYHSGRAHPWHYTAEDWAAYLDECVPSDRRAALAHILDTYEIDP